MSEQTKKITNEVYVIIPAHNEEKSVPLVISDIQQLRIANEIIVIDNQSSDRTFQQAIEKGATSLREHNKGYGLACLKGMDYLEQKSIHTDSIIVFMDGDHSDFATDMPELLKPIVQNDYDMVIGSRALGNRESGSMTFPQVFGNWLSTKLIEALFGYQFTDLGPFRAVKWHQLRNLQMEDKNYGWTVEMQAKAAKYKYKCIEVPVDYRKRIGQSKVSGTIKGATMAGIKIIYTILKIYFSR
jgi:glycosyltransferase involved in cell wall biosynthesis